MALVSSQGLWCAAMMHHRRLVLVGLVVLLLQAGLIWYGRTRNLISAHTNIAFPSNDSLEASAIELETRAKEEARQLFASECETVPQNGLHFDCHLSYRPAYGPGGKVAVQIIVEQRLKRDDGKHERKVRALPQELRRLVLTYAAVDGRWVEVEKPRWEVRDKSPTTQTQVSARR